MSTSAPALPATAKGRATRERIVSAAARLMLVDGVARTTLDDVGAEARVGRSQLYHYFDDKARLVEAVIAHHAESVLGGDELVRLDDWEAWRAWRDAVVAGQEAQACVGGCPLGSLASELSDIDDRARRALGVTFDEWERRFRRGLEAMARRGALATGGAPGRLATTVLAALEGGLLLAQLRRSTAPLEAALDGVLELLGAPERP
ncbi:TetR/AcrR family transcriptional regulator [Pseudolysinimonas kribbensis]|uniref:TetR/AcrR family transcriptional regulator n=1 Tax=Pseudolysinimonas kribbensis TaxID=433641 RepID=UPI0031D07505